MKRISFALLVALFTLVGAQSARAQATLNLTTLSAAVTSTSATTITVASATNVVTGDLAFVDHEVMLVTGISSTTLTVQRGYNGTRAALHLTGAPIYVDLPSNFYLDDVQSGACTAANQPVLPHVNPATGQIASCVNGRWQGTAIKGYTAFAQSEWPRTPLADVAYTALYTDVIIAYTTMSTGRTVTLPSAVAMAGKVFIIKDEANIANSDNITVATTSSQKIDGSSTKVINTAYGVLRVYSDGANYFTWAP